VRYLIGFFLILLVKLMFPIDPDEAEHLHFAFLINKGYEPFKDFYQHHLPLIWELFSISIVSKGFFSNVFYARIIQAIIISLTGLFFSKCFKTNQSQIFLLFCLIFTLLNPFINYGDIRPELIGSLLFTSSYYFLITDKKLIKFLIPISLITGMLFTPRFLPIYLAISYFYFFKTPTSNKYFFVIIQIIILSIFFSFYKLKDIAFFVFQSTSQLKRSFDNIFGLNETSLIMMIYFISILIVSLINFKKSKILSTIYIFLFVFIFLEKHPYYSQSTIFLFLTSLLLVFNLNFFKKFILNTKTLYLIISVSVITKIFWISSSRNKIFFEELPFYKNQLQNCKDMKVLFSFHKEYMNGEMYTHPIFLEDLSYFGFIQNAILSEKHMIDIIKYTNKSIYLYEKSESCLTNDAQYKKIKNILNEN